MLKYIVMGTGQDATLGGRMGRIAALASAAMALATVLGLCAQDTPPLPATAPASSAREAVPQPPPVPAAAPQVPPADDRGGKWAWSFRWKGWDGIRWSVHREFEHQDPFKDVSYLDLGQFKFTGKIGGRLLVDAASLGGLPSSNSGNDYEVRKASVYMMGKWVLLAPFTYKVQFDYVADHFTTQETWIRWEHLPYIGGFKTGQYGVPYGLENTMSGFDWTMMEMSSAVMALAPGTNWGFQIGAPVAKKRMTWILGVFAPASYQESGDASKNYVRIVTRLTGLVFDRSDWPNPEYLHLGLSLSWLYSGNAGIEYQSRPESHLAPYLVNTGQIKDGKPRQAAFEAAWVTGPFSLQGEYLASRVYRDNLPSVNFEGYYVLGTVSLTGESRPYDKNEGVLTGLKPYSPFTFKHGGRGAWELALRLSHVNLTDKDIQGGRMNTATLGATWYMNAQAKVMINWVHGNVTGPLPYKTINILEFRIGINI